MIVPVYPVDARQIFQSLREVSRELCQIAPGRSNRSAQARGGEQLAQDMTQLIVLDTVFDAPIAEVCAMSLSVNLHLDSMTHHREKVVAGRTTGQFVESDVVT